MIITLCGSARFEQDFKKWNERLTLAGHTVFSLAVYPSDKQGEKNWYTEEQKRELDAAHFRKIEASEAILVINTDGYIGESTTREIFYAHGLGRRIVYTHTAFYNKNLVPGREVEGGYLATSQIACPYAGCSDPFVNRPPCALCYE